MCHLFCSYPEVQNEAYSWHARRREKECKLISFVLSSVWQSSFPGAEVNSDVFSKQFITKT